MRTLKTAFMEFRNTNAGPPFHLLRAALILCFMLFATGLRILPHPWNFTPIGAMALFCGAKLNNKWAAFLVPLVSLFTGDLFIGFHKLMLIVYLSFCVSVLIGRYFRNRQTIVPLSIATSLGALQFFLITNFAFWLYASASYPKTLRGLVWCYANGLSLLGNTLAGDAFYAVVLFGGFALAERLGSGFRATATSGSPAPVRSKLMGHKQS